MIEFGVCIDICGQICRFQALPGSGGLNQGVCVDFAIRSILYGTFLHALFAYQASQGAGINAGQADNALFCQPGIKMILGAPIGWRRDRIAKHCPDGRFGGVYAGFFMIFRVCADISDMRKGEQNHLFSI